MKIAVINGPNLNMLGVREPEIYGKQTLEDINAKIMQLCSKYNFEAEFYQNNIEGELINIIHSLNNRIDYAIINPGAYTHTSVAVYDAIKCVSYPVIEVHLSNIHKRPEAFRHISITAGACLGQITGFGDISYLTAIETIAHLQNNQLTVNN